MSHKSGFISIIGKPNAGKSSLMNALLGQKLTIVTPKAQTTRHRIKGIINHENYQLVFSDTPGIIEPVYLLQKKMMDFVSESLTDADLVLFVSDLTETYHDKQMVSLLNRIKSPVIIVINKADLSSQNEINKLIHGWKKAVSPGAVIPVSALHGFNIAELLETILGFMPEGPAYFEKENVSDSNLRFFAAEFIRESIFNNYGQEIPYACQVEIEEFKEEKNINRIRAIIYVERDSQKSILIGKQGSALKKTGTQARIEFEKFTGKKLFLEIYVKVQKEWRKNENMLRRFGYSDN